MKITKEIAEKAFKTAHEPCQPECVHAEALGQLEKEMEDKAAKAGLVALLSGQKSKIPYVVLFEGIHIGYRLAQLMQEEEELSKLVNSAKGSVN